MRANRVLAIARRDLALELAGRRGWILPLILFGLLFPTTTLRAPLPQRPSTPPTLRVSGEVPPAVRALDVVTDEGRQAQLTFRREDDATIVRARSIRDDVRKALDGEAPALTIERARRPVRLPGRSLLFALISASTLTGAVSTSMAGERASGTLVGLLTAAVTRLEVVIGKWLAWGGLGATASVLAALGAIAMGRVDPGWWLLPLPCVAPATVALGFWLVRRATDVVTGTTVSLRVLPAILSITGLGAWFLGRIDPLLGASVPLGGALVAAGATWGGLPPAIVALGSSLGLSLACLVATARDLEDAPAEPLSGRTLRAVASACAVAAGLWWLPVLLPVLWGEAGNPGLSRELPAAAGALAGGLGLTLLAVTHAAHERSIFRALGLNGSWRSPRVGLGLLAGLTLGALPLAPWFPVLTSQFGSSISTRLTGALSPAHTSALAPVLVLLGHELFFRGWLQRRWGPCVAVLAYTVVVTPTDPVFGLITGCVLSGVVHIARAGTWPSLLAHAVWVAAVVAR